MNVPSHPLDDAVRGRLLYVADVIAWILPHEGLVTGLPSNDREDRDCNVSGSPSVRGRSREPSTSAGSSVTVSAQTAVVQQAPGLSGSKCPAERPAHQRVHRAPHMIPRSSVFQPRSRITLSPRPSLPCYLTVAEPLVLDYILPPT